MSVTVRQVSNIPESDLDAYTKVLAESFGYQFFAGALGNDRELQEPIHRAHLGAANTGEGEVHIAELPDVGVVGVAVWFGPGKKFLETETQRSAGWDALMARLPEQYRAWWSETFLKEYDALTDRVLAPGLKRGAYALQLIGVAPAYQRKGVGSALMRFGEDKARAAHVPTELETVGATNIGIYKSLGYEVAGTGPLQAPPPAPVGASFEMAVFVKHVEKEE
ncbi:hypothetical protein BD413DRAFT_231135 [Trametes elegans]|nr:hypothetical protein BD413DRAFT_231135 [Trametes elegans]